MKTIIAGSRTITREGVVEEAIFASGYAVTEIFSGGAGGVDSLAEEYALNNSIKLTRYPVHDFEWAAGRDAGYRRNEAMVAEAQALIAIWDGRSKGTAHVIKHAKAAGLLVYVYREP